LADDVDVDFDPPDRIDPRFDTREAWVAIRRALSGDGASFLSELQIGLTARLASALAGRRPFPVGAATGTTELDGRKPP